MGLDSIIKAALWEVLLLISRKAEEPCDREKFLVPQSPSGPLGSLALGAKQPPLASTWTT